MNTPRVAIIVLNYNGTADTLECLRSLTRRTYPNAFVVLVDNASRDAAALEQAARAEFSDVHFLSCADNAGFAGGNNAGIRFALDAGCDHVLLLNNDTTVAPDFIERMVAAMNSDPNMGIVGAKIYFSNEPDTIWYNGARFSWTDGGKHEQYGERDAAPRADTLLSTLFVTGCAMLISRAVIERIGMLEESFFMYYEDIDYCLHAQRSGFRICVAEGAHVWHKVSRTAIGMGTPRIQYYHVRNALLNVSRNASFITQAGVYAWSAYHFKKQALKYIVFPKRRDTARMIMRGIVDFYRGKFGKFQD